MQVEVDLGKFRTSEMIGSFLPEGFLTSQMVGLQSSGVNKKGEDCLVPSQTDTFKAKIMGNCEVNMVGRWQGL